MSLSIVLEGRLWGMLACHLRSPREVPYVTRAACALLAAHVQAQLTAEQSAEERMHERLRARLLNQVQHAVQPAQVLMAEAAEIARVFDADAVLATNTPACTATAMCRWRCARNCCAG